MIQLEEDRNTEKIHQLNRLNNETIAQLNALKYKYQAINEIRSGVTWIALIIISLFLLAFILSDVLKVWSKI